MAHFELLNKGRRQAGQRADSAAVDVSGMEEFRCTISPENAAEFDDPSLFIEATITVSMGGREQTVSATIVGGARSKNGSLPSIAVASPGKGGFPKGTTARISYVQNAAKRIGIAGETKGAR